MQNNVPFLWQNFERKHLPIRRIVIICVGAANVLHSAMLTLTISYNVIAVELCRPLAVILM